MNQLADYRLVRRLGGGNHGELHLAVAPERLGLDDAWVAVKVLAPNATDADFTRMATELRVFASVASPHIVTLYDAGHHDGRLFYAMRYHPDGSLEHGPALPREVAVQAVVDAARAVHALHEVGVVHRDVKPANVLIEGGRGFLTDLALALVDTPGMTTTGVGPIGSIAYMEPDVVYGERATRASDIWSLALTLHHALAGTGVYGPIPTSSVLAAFRHVLGTRPVIDASIAGPVRAVIARALAERRADRHSTALEFAADLARAEGAR